MKPNELTDLEMSPARVMLVLESTKEAVFIGDRVPAYLRREYFPISAKYDPESNLLEINVRKVWRKTK